MYVRVCVEGRGGGREREEEEGKRAGESWGKVPFTSFFLKVNPVMFCFFYTFQAFLQQKTPTKQRLDSVITSCMWHAQEHHKSYTQPLVNLVSARSLAHVVGYFHNTKRKNTLTHTMQLFFDSYRFYVGENSRTFQDLIKEFKDFSSMYGIQGLFKDSL